VAGMAEPNCALASLSLLILRISSSNLSIVLSYDDDDNHDSAGKEAGRGGKAA
jgi:hypothetical protein